MGMWDSVSGWKGDGKIYSRDNLDLSGSLPGYNPVNHSPHGHNDQLFKIASWRTEPFYTTRVRQLKDVHDQKWIVIVFFQWCTETR